MLVNESKEEESLKAKQMRVVDKSSSNGTVLSLPTTDKKKGNVVSLARDRPRREIKPPDRLNLCKCITLSGAECSIVLLNAPNN